MTMMSPLSPLSFLLVYLHSDSPYRDLTSHLCCLKYQDIFCYVQYVSSRTQRTDNQGEKVRRRNFYIY